MKNLKGLVLILLILSCNKQHRANEITKIELARSGGVYIKNSSAISIDSSLNYKRFNVETKQYFEGKISQGFWDTINSRVRNVKQQILKSSDTNVMAMDADCWELIVYWENGRSRIIKQVISSNDSLSSTLLWLSNSFRDVKLKEVAYSIKFETEFQGWPTPSMHQIKFPPPKIKK